MRRTSFKEVLSSRRKIKVLSALFFVIFAFSACASVNIKAAQSLGKVGRSVAVQAQQNIMISDKEYLRARDSEALYHGYNGTENSCNYIKILELSDNIQQELSKRSVVFDKLADLYDAFGELAGLDAGAQTEKALGDLGGAISAYATQIKQPAPLSSDTTAAISKIGGIITTEIQKTKIKEASILIREKVEAFEQLLGNKLVREQITGFREFLSSTREAAFLNLWDAGVYDPKPLLDDFGADAGIVAQNNAAALIKSDPKLGKALREVVNKRLKRSQFNFIERSYDESLSALRHLVLEHKKLERGEPLDLTRLQTIVAELRGIAVVLGKAKDGSTVSQ